MCVAVCMYTCAQVHRCQKRTLGLLELELQANTVSLQMSVLQTKLGSSRKVVRALDNESCLQPMALYFNKRKSFKPQYKIQRSQNEAGKFVTRF